MKKKIVLLLLAAAMVAPGCKKKNNVIDREILNPVDITFSEKEKHLLVGETYQLNPYYGTSEEQLNGTFNYRSLNESVAAVSSTGLITAVGKGTCIIEVTCNTSKSLFKVVVEEKSVKSILNFYISEKNLTLYEEDYYELSYTAILNNEVVNPAITYSNFNSDVINIVDGKIFAVAEGLTSLVVTATFNDFVANETVSVEVVKASYILSCNLTNKQHIVGDVDLDMTYSLIYKGEVKHTYTLEQLSPSVSNTEIATIVNHKLHAIKKGYVELHTSVYVGEIDETISSTETIRIREKYYVTHLETGTRYEVLDGDKVSQKPVNADPNLVFDCWLKNGKEFDEPINEDISLDIQWKIINEFNFSSDTRGAYVHAPSEPVEANKNMASAFNGDGEFENGLIYPLIINCHDGNATLEIAGHIYLPKMDYRKTTKVSYRWETDGYVTAEDAHWYGGDIRIGGTIDILNDGHTITEVITQTYDVNDPFTPSISYKDVAVTYSFVDDEVLNGNRCLKSIEYWTYESVGVTKNIMLSNPKVTYAEEYIPNFSLGIHGAYFSTDDQDAHYEQDNKKPTVVPGESGGKPYLYYYQDRAYNESEGWVHNIRVDYTLALPKVNFGKYERGLSIPYEVEGGLYIGLAEDKIVGDLTNVKGYFEFQKISDNIINFVIRNESKAKLFEQEITDSDVINGTASYILPVCYSTFCFQRGLFIYQPSLLGPHEHVYVADTSCIGKEYCTECGDARGCTPIFDFTENLYGIMDWDEAFGVPDPGWVEAINATSFKYVTYTTTRDVALYLPKIYFAHLQSLSVDITVSNAGTVYRLDKGGSSYAVASSSYQMKLEFTNITESSMTVNLRDSSNEVVLTKTVSDSTIISGANSFVIHTSGNGIVGWDVMSNFVFTL